MECFVVMNTYRSLDGRVWTLRIIVTVMHVWELVWGSPALLFSVEDRNSHIQTKGEGNVLHRVLYSQAHEKKGLRLFVIQRHQTPYYNILARGLWTLHNT